MTKVDAVIYELKEWLAHDPRAFLRRLKAALGDAKFQALKQQLLAQYDERLVKQIADIPPSSAGLPEGTLDEPTEEA